MTSPDMRFEVRPGEDESGRPHSSAELTAGELQAAGRLLEESREDISRGRFSGGSDETGSSRCSGTWPIRRGPLSSPGL